MMNPLITIDDACQRLIDNCLGCGQCIAECQMLQEINEDITDIAQRRPRVEEGYACTLCGLCEAICPQGLSPEDMFAARRTQAVTTHETDIEEFRYMFPDRAANVMKIYREVNGFDYQELSLDQQSEVAFFPGCTLLTYDPELTKAVYSVLRRKYETLTLLSDCCSLPLFQLGLTERAQGYLEQLGDKLARLQVKKLILACPNCYYQLQTLVETTEIELITIFEALEDSEEFNTPINPNNQKTVTIHDSCPDRFALIFAEQARATLLKKGYRLAEMTHHKENTLCCGSGGQVTHSRPDLAEDLVTARLEEAKDAHAEVLTACCMGCVLNLSKNQNRIPVQHVLNLLLDLEQDFYGFKKKAKAIFDGPEGQALWERIMAAD